MIIKPELVPPMPEPGAPGYPFDAAQREKLERYVAVTRANERWPRIIRIARGERVMSEALDATIGSVLHRGSGSGDAKARLRGQRGCKNFGRSAACNRETPGWAGGRVER
jgi:hypothetical protein